ncbi:hypothetical protein IAQ61_003861 [Plenodomus lingam]|uniref:uncharacterized protein n=1 Tax=Leptosphaeria maculans TaxID=5022 RepID=UPI00331DA705|nr:hypothetical protein IAQ61_003861 [Plenodomus lingam]
MTTKHELPYVSSELQLILLVLRCLDVDTGPHGDPSYKLLTDEVPDLNLEYVVLVLLDVDVDGETALMLASSFSLTVDQEKPSRQFPLVSTTRLHSLSSMCELQVTPNKS